MKKFFLSLAVFVMALCANAQTNQYFWYNGNLMMGDPIAQIDSVTFGEGEPADTLTSTPSATDLIVMVYSNAYDGFLNVREQPDVKSPIIGKILNGPMGAVKMGEVGGWTIVKVGETIGYASSRYLQTEPTAEFTDKDMEKCIQGIWATKQDGVQQAIVLMKGGVFVKGDFSQGWTSCGNWSVNGNVLTWLRE